MGFSSAPTKKQAQLQGDPLPTMEIYQGKETNVPYPRRGSSSWSGLAEYSKGHFSAAAAVPWDGTHEIHDWAVNCQMN